MRKYSKYALYRYAGKTDFLTFLKTFYARPEFRYIFYFRLAQAYKGKLFLGFMARYMLKRMKYRFHIQIWPETQIGEGLYISHFGNMGINPETIIGRNFNIANGVSIGQANRGRLKGSPVIGDDVWVGANAIIVGNIKIGNDVLIAPGAFVNFDVPDHSIVIGNPGTIKQKENATEGYINRRVIVEEKGSLVIFNDQNKAEVSKKLNSVSH
jgi:serine O-acetyltransferase